MYLQLSGELRVLKGTLRPFELGKASNIVGAGLARSSKCPAVDPGHSLGSWWHGQARPPAHRCDGQDQAWRGEPGWDAAWMARQEHREEQAGCGLGTGPRPMDGPGLSTVVAWVRSGSPWQDPTGGDVAVWQHYSVLKVPYILQFPNISIHSNCETFKDDCNVIIATNVHLSN